MNRGGELTQLLLEFQAGSKVAEDRLLEVVYPKLRQIAKRYLRNERLGHTLQPTALVHEAYIQLAGTRNTLRQRVMSEVLQRLVIVGNGIDERRWFLVEVRIGIRVWPVLFVGCSAQSQCPHRVAQPRSGITDESE